MIKIDEISAVSSPAQKGEMRAKFDEYGYVVVRGVLDPEEDLQPVIDEYNQVLDGLAKEWVATGELSSEYAHLPFDERLVAIVSETGDKVYDHFRIFFNPPSATTADSPLHVGPSMFGLLTNPKLLDVIENFIGSEILLNPVNVVRIKVPEQKLPKDQDYHIGMTAAWWHQDQGVFADDISEIDMLTVWLSLYDVTKESACLQVIPGSHRQGLSVHCSSGDPTKVGIPELLLGNVRHLIELKAGDVHFHHRRIQHGSLRNLSNRLRFSFDLRYQSGEQMHGQSGGVPRGIQVPCVTARSQSNPETEMRDWREWQALQEGMREQFMAVDWENDPPMSQFTEDHRYCI